MSVITLGIASEEVKYVRNLLANKSQGSSDDGSCGFAFACEGLWAADKLIESGLTVTHFFVNNEIDYQSNSECRRMMSYANKTYGISHKACQKISERDGSDDYFIVARLPRLTLDDIKLEDNMVISILDGLEQPGNIGAILRSIDCAGGSACITTHRRVKPTHSRLIRSSLGAAFMMPHIDADYDMLTKWLIKNGFKVILTDLTAKIPYYEADYSGRIAIVSDNEYTGISASWRDLPNAVPIIIPMMGSCESLNVGFATTLVAYEAGLRQKFGKDTLQHT